MNKPPGFRIGRDPTAHLTVSHACKPTRPVKVYGSDSDSGWHAFHVNAAVPGFTADFTFETRLADIHGFRDEVEAMSGALRGTAAITSMEHELRLTATINKRGYVVWQGVLRRIDGVNVNELEFSLEEDPMHLTELVSDLDALLAAARADTTVTGE